MRQAGCTWDDSCEAEALAGDSRSLRQLLGAALAADGDLRTSFVASFASAVRNRALLQRILMPLQTLPVRGELATWQVSGNLLVWLIIRWTWCDSKALLRST